MKMLFQVHFDWLAEVCHTFLMTVQLIDKMEKTEGKWEREVFGLVLLVTWNCVEMSIGISSSIAQTSPIQASTFNSPPSALAVHRSNNRLRYVEHGNDGDSSSTGRLMRVAILS